MERLKIIEVNYENRDIHGGCPTCDYGSRTIREMYLKYEDGTTWEFHMDVKGLDWGISESDWILIICNANTLDDIIKGIKEKLSYILGQDWMEKEIYYEINGARTYLTGKEE